MLSVLCLLWYNSAKYTLCVCEFCFETKTLKREKVPQKSYIYFYYVSSSLTKKLKCGKKKRKEEDQHKKNISLYNSAKICVLM